MRPGAPVDIDGHKPPAAWQIEIPLLSLSIECRALNARAWNGTSFAYWEGPISFKGSHSGVGYLEMTGY
jgi:predicted secreted hydrolase